MQVLEDVGGVGRVWYQRGEASGAAGAIQGNTAEVQLDCVLFAGCLGAVGHCDVAVGADMIDLVDGAFTGFVREHEHRAGRDGVGHTGLIDQILGRAGERFVLRQDGEDLVELSGGLGDEAVE